MNNEVPATCKSHPDVTIPSNGCAYSVWSNNSDYPPGWCQLADDGCTIIPGKSTSIVWEKPQASNYFTMTGDCDAVGDCVMSNNYPATYGHDEECSVTMSQDASVTVGNIFYLEKCCDNLMIRGKDVESPDAVPLTFINGESFSWSSDYSVSRNG